VGLGYCAPVLLPERSCSGNALWNSTVPEIRQSAQKGKVVSNVRDSCGVLVGREPSQCSKTPLALTSELRPDA
jgi:hypothetical protein